MHTERAYVAKQYSLQVRIFIENDKCIERLLRKTAKQVINTGITTTIKCFSYNILAATDVVAAIFCFSYNKML